MRMHVTPFVADQAEADQALRPNVETDLVILATRQLGPRLPGTPRWEILSSTLPRGEEAWMNAQAEFEEAVREVRARQSREELVLERRREVFGAVAEALASTRHLMKFKTTRWLFLRREEPFRARLLEHGIDVWYGGDKIEVRGHDSAFRLAVNGYSEEMFGMRGSTTAATARSITRTIMRHLARTAIPRRTP